MSVYPANIRIVSEYRGTGLIIRRKTLNLQAKINSHMNIETFISDAVRRSVETLYGELGDEQLQIQKTRKEFEGD